MLSTLRAGKNVFSLNTSTKQSGLHFLFRRPSGRSAFSGHAYRFGSRRQVVKRYSSNEAKTTVRAIPVESTRAGFTGK